jgi:hypothetical protein
MIKSFLLFESEDHNDLKHTLELLFLDKVYKTTPKGNSSVESDEKDLVGQSMFVENAIGYEYQVEFTDFEDGKLSFRYRMIHPFYQSPFEK